ncbi:hypothetical protein [Spiroplasma endosymbiont of Diplazon laetatorius]|uniref:hypothetical protein n=1 Tax=Spiroplasma endosymbiont of Diplazon laetatorius TaxID=3066322 RepID=UPI0030D11AE4
MKKLLGILSVSALTVGSTAPIINYALFAPSQTVIKNFKYSYDFKNLNWNDIKWENKNGIKVAELSSDEFTKSLTDCIQLMFDSIPERDSNIYKINMISTTFTGFTESANNNVEVFSKEFVDAKKDLNKMDVQNHRLVIEQYTDPNNGTFYYINVFATINKKEVRLYGGNSSERFSDLSEIKSQFTNNFELEITMEVWIDGEDSLDWGIFFPENIDFQLKSQMINWFMDDLQSDMRAKVIAHINEEKNTSLTKIDRPKKIYRAIPQPGGKTFISGEEIPDNELIKDPYFYIGIESKEQAFGEYKVLIKNRPPKEEVIEYIKNN